MTGINLMGLPHSGAHHVADVLAAAGIATTYVADVPVVRCSPHGASRVVAETLDALPPGATTVLVYRNPWDSVLAALESGEPWLVGNPDMMRRAWQSFHQAFLAHLAQSRRDVLLVAYEAVIAQPQSLIELVLNRSPRQSMDAPLEGLRPAQVGEPTVRGRNEPIGALYGLLYRDLLATLDELDSLGALPWPRNSGYGDSCPEHIRHGGSLAAGTGIQVILPCRNDGQYLAEAVASVAASTRKPVELTIVDDGSDDPETLRVMDLLANAGYQVLRTSGVGLSAARNAATAVSKTAAVIPLDADNRLRPPLFEAVRLITGDRADALYGPVQYIGLEQHAFYPEPLTWSTVLPHNPVDVCSMVSRRLIERIGGWDPSISMWEDWDFWMSALEEQARFEVLPDITFDYCVRPGSMLRTSGRDAQVRAEAFRSIVAKHSEALFPVIFEAFIDVDQQRYDLLRSLAKTRAEAALLREQQVLRLNDAERTE